MASLSDLSAAAPGYLKTYCSPASAYAWPHYDEDLLPTVLTATDLLAPAYLSYPIKRTYLEQMHRLVDGATNEYGRLRLAMEAVVADQTAAVLDFESVEVDGLNDRDTPGWGLVLRALDEAQHCSGLTSVAVTKILHRKRPRLVPINDSRVRAFFEVEKLGFRDLFQRIHQELNDHEGLLNNWSSPYRLPDGRKMMKLRAMDIAIWMSFEKQ